jgi:hypothetical protein
MIVDLGVVTLLAGDVIAFEMISGVVVAGDFEVSKDFEDDAMSLPSGVLVRSCWGMRSILPDWSWHFMNTTFSPSSSFRPPIPPIRKLVTLPGLSLTES